MACVHMGEVGCYTLVKETAGELSQHLHEIASWRMYLAHTIIVYWQKAKIPPELQNFHVFCKMQWNFTRSSGSLILCKKQNWKFKVWSVLCFFKIILTQWIGVSRRWITQWLDSIPKFQDTVKVLVLFININSAGTGIQTTVL